MTIGDYWDRFIDGRERDIFTWPWWLWFGCGWLFFSLVLGAP